MKTLFCTDGTAQGNDLRKDLIVNVKTTRNINNKYY